MDKEQFDKMVDEYVEKVMSTMTVEAMQVYVYNDMVASLSNYSDNELLDLVENNRLVPVDNPS